jgi:hypothetical protein
MLKEPHPFCHADAGAIDQHPRRAVRLGCLADGGFCRGGVGDVADHGDATDLRSDAFGQFCVEVAYGDLRALRGEPARGCGAQSRCAASDDRGLILQLHGILPGELIFG